MFNPFKKKTVIDHAEEFYRTQQKTARIVMYKYLVIWFKQIFQDPSFKLAFGEDKEIYKTLAAQVVNYLSAEEIGIVNDETPKKIRESIEAVLPHVEKWADDVIKQDKEFAELAIQTLRMDIIFKQYQHGTEYLEENEQGRRTKSLLSKYGELISSAPDPKSYSKLINKFIMWDNTIGSKFKEEFEA